MKTIFLLLGISFTVINVSCSKDSTSPNEKIIGKWKLIAEGSSEYNIQSIERENSDIEYLVDGKMRTYGVLNEKYRDDVFQYKIDDNFIYYYYCFGGITTSDNDAIHRYNFNKNNDKLTLKIIQGNIPDVYGFPIIYVYERIK